MKIPIYEELILDDFSVDYLKEMFKKSKIGSQPMYTSLHKVVDQDRPHAISNIEIALKALQKSPLFPYPYYIISETYLRSSIIGIFSSTQELPTHYYKKTKRLKNKELLLLNKVGVICEKVTNIPIYKNQKIIQESAVAQRDLYKHTKELGFYEEVLSTIKENGKKNG